MRRLLTAVAAVACLALVGPAEASAQNQTPNQDYVAMGDSGSSGNGTGSYYESTCYRSYSAYGPLIDANYLPPATTFSHPACSGASTNNIDQDAQNGFPKQIDLLGANTDYVTITIGSNDISYGTSVATCANPFGDCDSAMNDVQRWAQNNLPAVMSRAFASIRSKAPNAVVVVVGFPRTFAPNTDCNVVFSAAEVNKINATVDIINNVTRQRTQAAGVGFSFADPQSAWIGHGVCSSSEWTNGVSVTDAVGSYHANTSGHQALAGMAASALLSARRPGQTIGANGRVAFTSNRDGNSEIYAANGNGSFPVDLTNDPGADSDPVYSPNGSKIAFSSNRDGDYEIYVMNADGSGLTKLTDNATYDDRDPDWSPNGDYIAFRSNRAGSNDEIYKMTAAGTSQVRLTNDSAADAAPDWSPDGSEIAFQRTAGANTDVWRMNSNGAGGLDLTPSTGSSVDGQPAWSPDGSLIAFQSNRDGDFDIYTVGRIAPPATPAVTPPTPVNRTSNSSISDREPAYSPDGSRLTFTSNRDGNDEIYTATATGGSPQRLTSQSAADALPSWQGDQTAPQTTIDSGPGGTTSLTTPSFTFSSDEPGSSFECRIDGGSYSTCASPLTTDPLGEGAHSLDVRATDPSGNVDGTPASSSFTIVPPANTAITSGPTGTTNDPTPTFEFASSDPGATYECKVDNGAYASCTSPQTTDSLGDGPHTFTVQGTDSHGTPDPEAASVSFSVDATAPDTSLDVGPSSPTSDAGPSFEFSSAEGTATFECRIDGGSWDSCSSPHQYGGDLTDGSHTFEVRAVDAAGNTDASPATSTFTVDTAAPQTTITSSAPGEADSTPTFTFESDEAGSSFECRIDGAPFEACGTPFTTDELLDGNHTFGVRATDEAGNTDPTPAAVDFTIDATAPQTSIDSGPGVSSPGQLTNDRTPTWTFSSDDIAADFECQVDSGAWSSCDQEFTAPSQDDGSHTFRVRATDAAANVDQSPAQVTFTVDGTVPQTTIDSGPANGSRTSDDTPSFEFSSSELGSFECRTDGSGPGGWGSCASPHTTASLSDGSHTFEVRATDAAANTDATPASRTFTVDTDAPTTSLTSAPPALTNDPTPSFSFSSPSDNDAGFDCRVDSGAWGSCTSPHTTASLSDGSHTFEVRATDAAGNADATPAQASFTVDTVVPSTTIIGAPLSPGNDRTPSFTFASSEATASFECSVDSAPYTSCSSPHELASLPEGQHSFDVRAVDQAGNTDPSPEHRTFVIDLTPPDTRITSGPEGAVTSASATFGFSASEPGSSFQCSLDGAAFSACSGTTATYDGLSEGAHRFEVRALDSAGNPDPTPASREFTVDPGIRDLSITAAPKQRAKPAKPRVIVIVSAGERVDVEATGKLKAGRKSVAIAPASASADAGSPLTLQLTPVASGAGTVKKVLKARKKVKAAVTVTVTDSGGHEQTAQLKVKLSR